MPLTHPLRSRAQEATSRAHSPVGWQQWVSHMMMSRLAGWASLGIGLASYWGEWCFLPSFWRELSGAMRVWRDLLEALSHATGHEGQAELASGLIPAAGPHSQAAYCLLNSGPLHLHLDALQRLLFIPIILINTQNFLPFNCYIQ